METFDDKHLLDTRQYFTQLTLENKLAQRNEFFPCACSGINSLQDILANLRRKKAFVCIDDTNDAATEQIGGGWFRRRSITVFVLIRYRMDDMEDRQQKLDICREIFRQFHSRMIRDKERFISMDHSFLDVSRIYTRELGEYFLSGCTGLYFMLEIPEPVNLMYDGSEWT